MESTAFATYQHEGDPLEDGNRSIRGLKYKKAFIQAWDPNIKMLMEKRLANGQIAIETTDFSYHLLVHYSETIDGHVVVHAVSARYHLYESDPCLLLYDDHHKGNCIVLCNEKEKLFCYLNDCTALQSYLMEYVSSTKK